MFLIDLESGKGDLECSQRLTQGVFCGGMRLDQSSFRKSFTLSKCSEGTEYFRTAYNFQIPEEDMAEHSVSLYVKQNCSDRLLYADDVAGIVVSMTSGDLPTKGALTAPNFLLRQKIISPILMLI